MPTIELTVARGRTIRHDGDTYPAGSTIRLPAADAARLTLLGYCHRPGEAPTVTHVVPMVSTPEGQTPIGRVSEHAALTADRGRHFVRR